MGNTKNLVFSVLIVVSFIFLWDQFVVSRYAKPQQPSTNEKAATEEPSTKIAESQISKEIDLSMVKGTLGPSKEIVLENESSNVTFETKGARVISWQIKEKNNWIELVYKVDDSKQFPFETYPKLIFSVERQTSDSVVFAADHPKGFRIQKSIQLGEGPELGQVQLNYSNLTSQELQFTSRFGWGPGIDKSVAGEEIEDKDKKVVQAEMRVVGLADKVRTWRPGFIFGRSINKKDPAEFTWAGVDNDHFIFAFIGMGDPIQGIKIVADKKIAPLLTLPEQITLQPGQIVTLSYPFYVGPKEMSVLKEVGHEMEKSVDFGFFGIISKILLKGLEFFKKSTGNYGWAIIILTVCVQILFYPLTKKSLQHSLKMKEVQPQLKKIQAQFKSDPKRLQIETFNLYKKHGMKFMGMEGCFPMLVQIPIFFAFYRTLRVAYELRGAPWIFWIKDLALPDPFYVLPILMGGGMMLQQKLTAVAMDPTQAKMMLIMPIVFTFLFLKLPAGLVLYWVVNSITTIVVQKILQWRNSSQPKTAT